MAWTRGWLAAALAALIGAAALAARAEEEKPVAAKADALAWLAGTWRSEGDGGWEEVWLPPKGGSVVAVSRALKAGKADLYELTVVEEEGDGLVFRIRHFGRGLVPWKMDAAGPMTMKLVKKGEREATFEDATREFPRRIVYRRPSDDVLVARLEGSHDGKDASQEFRFQRVADGSR